MDQSTYQFDRKLLAACALTRRLTVVGLVMDIQEVPTFESIFVDGRVAVGSTASMLTATYDGSLIAENNPVAPVTGKMPFEHAALRVTPELLTRLTTRAGPATVSIILHPGSVHWIFGNTVIVVKDVISHPEDYDYADDDEDQCDYSYPDYRAAISRAVREMDDIEEPLYDAAAFSVALGSDTLHTLLRIASVIAKPSSYINGRWREGEAASIFVSGGTPSYHIVRYAAVSGFLNTDILSIVGSRSTKALGTSSVELFPEFALKDGCDRPNSIWSEADDDCVDDEVEVTEQDNDDSM